VLAAVGVQLRLLANMFDGMVAIETGRTSAVGELYNEVPDRVSDTAVLVGAGYAAGGCPVLGYVAALLAVFIAYVRAQGRVAGASQENGRRDRGGIGSRNPAGRLVAARAGVA
jgi:phosphatidylglycerophosphate synthase